MNQISGIQAALEGDAELSRHSQDLANSLIEMLQDPDSGVASAAASALRAAASQSDGAFQPAYHYGSTQPCCLAFLVPCFSVPAEAHVFGCGLGCTVSFWLHAAIMPSYYRPRRWGPADGSGRAHAAATSAAELRCPRAHAWAASADVLGRAGSGQPACAAHIWYIAICETPASAWSTSADWPCHNSYSCCQILSCTLSSATAASWPCWTMCWLLYFMLPMSLFQGHDERRSCRPVTAAAGRAEQHSGCAQL